MFIRHLYCFFTFSMTLLFCVGLNDQISKTECANKKEKVDIIGLPSTGQTHCFDDKGNKISCYSKEFPGQDGFYQSGYPMEGRFVDNGNGTVSDKYTGLMWQMKVEDLNCDRRITCSEDNMTWEEALHYCENLDFAGYNDWKLPNINELRSLVNYVSIENDNCLIISCKLFDYWSSTSFKNNPTEAWTILYNGLLIQDKKMERHNVLAVRYME